MITERQLGIIRSAISELMDVYDFEIVAAVESGDVFIRDAEGNLFPLFDGDVE